MGWIIALMGLAASAAGSWAIVMGWPLVTLERGWTMVISGAALGSGGLVCLALAAQIFETRRARLAIEKGFAQLATQSRESPVSHPAPAPPTVREAEASKAASPEPAAVPRAVPSDAKPSPASEAAPVREMQPARSFTVGDTTFVVFADGSIEARTVDGTRRFSSMDEVRAYLGELTSG